MNAFCLGRSVSPATEHVSTLTATALNFPASASPSSASSWPTSTCRTWLKHYSAAATRRLRSTCGRPIASLCAARAVHCRCALLCALGSGHAPRSSLQAQMQHVRGPNFMSEGQASPHARSTRSKVPAGTAGKMARKVTMSRPDTSPGDKPCATMRSRN